uniref:uncharacterized protein LOC120331002 n=1 Tax=Styela clava TaxID=7725 RepID=UPI00193939C0|nr:uncharacterized protein LOC120331002 [Styela clava]
MSKERDPIPDDVIQETAVYLEDPVPNLPEPRSRTSSFNRNVNDNKSSDSPHRNIAPSTPKKIAAAGVKAEVDSIGGWSDTLSVKININQKSSESMSEEKKSLLEIDRLNGSRRASSTISGGPPASPRQGSRGSRRSTRGSRRHKSSQGNKEPTTRGEILMDLVRNDSIKSRETTRPKSSASNRESGRKHRKNSDTSSSSSSSDSLASGEGPAGFPRKGKRGYFTAQDAVELGDRLCGCVLMDKFLYFLKPVIFIVIGAILITGGLALTVLHFMYEDSLTQKNPPYFTYGPISLATGVILFMVGLVWVPIKEQKWKDGTASPMIAALAKWRLENLEKEELQMTNIGEVKCIPSEEEIDQTTLVTSVKETDTKFDEEV